MLRVVYFSDGGVQALSDFLQFTLFIRRAGHRCPGRGAHILPVKSARFVLLEGGVGGDEQVTVV